jgi:hypothetical protein
VLFRVLGWVCGVLFGGVLWVLSCTVLFSLFPFSIKLLITYQKYIYIVHSILGNLVNVFPKVMKLG